MARTEAEVKRPERVSEGRWAGLDPVARKVVAADEARRCGCTVTDWLGEHTMPLTITECPLHGKRRNVWGYFWAGLIAGISVAFIAFLSSAKG